GLLAGAPHDAAKAPPGVAQRRHEQPWLAVASGARHARERALAVVDLHLFAGQELQPVELLRLALAQVAHEALDRAVLRGEAEPVDQVLVDGHGVAPQAQLRLDEGAMRLARRDGGRRRRWPGWGNLRGHQWRSSGGRRGAIGTAGRMIVTSPRGMRRRLRLI